MAFSNRKISEFDRAKEFYEKAIAIDENNNLELAQMAEPICQTDEVLIKVKTIGINRADILQRQGKYPPPVGESNVLGIEVCGDIIECGSDVKQWRLGQRVFCLVAGGGYAEVVKVKAAHLMLLPEALSYEQGAAIAEVFLTAYQSLFMIGKSFKREVLYGIIWTHDWNKLYNII